MKVQGITLNPGDRVLVLIGDRWVRRTFGGRSADGKAWMWLSGHTTSLDALPGPFSLDRLRHINVLDGFIKAVDAGA